MFSHRSTLKQSWGITRKYRYLWLFGLFAAITAAGGSWEYSLIAQSVGQNLIDSAYLQISRAISVMDVLNNFAYGLGSMFSSGFWNGLNALTILLFSLTVIVTLVWLGISSQGALVNALKKILGRKKSAEEIHYRENIAVGHQNFWPVLGLNIMIKLLVCFAFLLIALPLLLMSLQDSSLLGLVYVILFVLLVPLATGLSLAVKYAIAYQIFEKKGFVASLEKGFKLFIKHWLVSLEMAVLLFVISFLASLALVVVGGLFLAPIFVFGLITGALWLSFLAVFIAILIVIFFGALLSTFQITAWTSIFVSLKDNTVIAKLERLFGRK